MGKKDLMTTEDEEISVDNGSVEPMISLHKFADENALKYGIELMAGFFHYQEVRKKIVDFEQNFHIAIKEFSKKEVK